MAETKPNIIYILADDMGIGDAQCYTTATVNFRRRILIVWQRRG
ncbi:hypothetical protein [Pontiella sulfatireligans]|nr:hypothetical protein [Pontiella sulfatireligans]